MAAAEGPKSPRPAKAKTAADAKPRPTVLVRLLGKFQSKRRRLKREDPHVYPLY